MKCGGSSQVGTAAGSHAIRRRMPWRAREVVDCALINRACVVALAKRGLATPSHPVNAHTRALRAAEEVEP